MCWIARAVHLLEMARVRVGKKRLAAPNQFPFNESCTQYPCAHTWTAKCWSHDFSRPNRPGRNDTDNKWFLAKPGIETCSTGQALIEIVYNVLTLNERMSKPLAPDSGPEVACDAFVHTHMETKRWSNESSRPN